MGNDKSAGITKVPAEGDTDSVNPKSKVVGPFRVKVPGSDVCAETPKLMVRFSTIGFFSKTSMIDKGACVGEDEKERDSPEPDPSVDTKELNFC